MEYLRPEQPEFAYTTLESAQVQLECKAASFDLVWELHKGERRSGKALERSIRRYGHGESPHSPRRVYDQPG